MRTICLALTLSVLALPAMADDFYCHPDGADTNVGSAAAPFKTLAKGTSVLQSGRNDRLFILSGAYSEGLSINSLSGASLIGVGDVVIAALSLNNATGVLVENLTIRDAVYGWYAKGGGGILFRRLRFINNQYAGYAEGLSSSTFRECDFCCNNFYGIYIYGMTNCIFDRCTADGNAYGCSIYSNTSNCVLRNCIISNNTSGGIVAWSASNTVTERNCVFMNGPGDSQNYVNLPPGQGDIQSDPQFLDRARLVYALKESSPCLNAGRDVSGDAVSIGAHEVGILNSASANADIPFASWISSGDGKPVTDATAEVALDADGTLKLNGVARASVVSPVIDLGAEGKRVTRVEYRAQEDEDQPSGSKKVIDQDDATYVRTFRIRGSDTAFAALDASPAWIATTNGADLSSLRKQFVQIEITLTTLAR